MNYLTQFYQLTTSEGQLINNEFKVFKLNIEALIAQLNVYISRYDLFNEENLQCLIKETNGLCVGDCEGIYECLQVKIEEENSLQISIQDLEQIIAPFTNELKEKQNAQLQKLESEKKANERQAIDDQNRNMTNKATKFGLLATGAAAGGAVAGTINATAAGLITTQTITVASPLVAKAALTKVAAAAMAAGKPIIAKTIAAKAASITAAKTGSIVIAKVLAGKAAITALIPGVQVVILGACVGVGVYAAYKFFIE